MAQKFFFAGTVHDGEANNGLGELKARFTTGSSEVAAKSLANAFCSAAGRPGLNPRNGGAGVALWNETQLNQRIATVAGKPEHAETLMQLKRGAEALVQARSVNAAPGLNISARAVV